MAKTIDCGWWCEVLGSSVGRAFFFSGDALLLDAVDLVFTVLMDALLLPPGVCTDETSATSSLEVCTARVWGSVLRSVCGVDSEMACAILFAMLCSAIVI